VAARGLPIALLDLHPHIRIPVGLFDLRKTSTSQANALLQFYPTQKVQDLRICAEAGRSVESVMSKGTIKWYNGQKGYGFIQPDDGSKDVFVHISAVERAGLTGLNEGQQLTFDVERGTQGKTSAVNLQAV
jgi:cold shock protein